MNIFDIGFIIGIVLFIIVGYYHGLLKELGKVLALIFSFVSAKLLSVQVEPYVYNWLKVDDRLLEGVNGVVDKVEFSSLDMARQTLESGISDIPFVGSLLNGFTQNNWDITSILQSATTDIKADLTQYLMENVQPLAHNLITMGCVIVLFVISLILFNFIFNMVVKGLTSIKLVGSLDKLLGAGVGCIKGCLFLIMILVAIFLVLSISNSEYLHILMESKSFNIIQSLLNISI